LLTAVTFILMCCNQ